MVIGLLVHGGARAASFACSDKHSDIALFASSLFALIMRGALSLCARISLRRRGGLCAQRLFMFWLNLFAGAARMRSFAASFGRASARLCALGAFS
jgi:hypothetical protein